MVGEKTNGLLGGKEARESWQKTNKYPLQELRNYRNHLVHGRMLPVVFDISGADIFLPKIGFEDKYFDWRKITNQIDNQGFDLKELVPIREILLSAWNETIVYLEKQWKDVLLKL